MEKLNVQEGLKNNISDYINISNDNDIRVFASEFLNQTDDTVGEEKRMPYWKEMQHGMFTITIMYLRSKPENEQTIDEMIKVLEGIKSHENVFQDIRDTIKKGSPDNHELEILDKLDDMSGDALSVVAGLLLYRFDHTGPDNNNAIREDIITPISVTAQMPVHKQISNTTYSSRKEKKYGKKIFLKSKKTDHTSYRQKSYTPDNKFQTNKKSEGKRISSKYKPLSSGEYFIMCLVGMVPIVGLIYLAITLTLTKNENRRNATKGMLIYVLLMLASFVLLVLPGSKIVSLIMQGLQQTPNTQQEDPDIPRGEYLNDKRYVFDKNDLIVRI